MSTARALPATQALHALPSSGPSTTQSARDSSQSFRHAAVPPRPRRPRRVLGATTDQVYAFLVTYIGGHGFAPSYEEIARALDFRTLSTPAYHVKKLVKDGRIEHARGAIRSIRLVETPQAGASSVGV